MPAPGLKKIGEQLTAEWLENAGPEARRSFRPMSRIEVGSGGLLMIFAKHTDTRALAIKSVEGKAIAGTLLVRPLIKGEEMSLIEIDLAAGVASPLHAHDHESLIYVVKGKLKSVVGDKTFVLDPGDACRHPRGVSHFLEALEESTFVEIKSPAPDLTRFLGM